MIWLEYLVFLFVALGLAWPAGHYMARVFGGERTWLDPLLRPLERALYQAAGVDPALEMTAGAYTIAFCLAGLVGTLVLFAILMGQRVLPLGPADAYLSTDMTLDLAANTAISFATTTTWQAYGGETTLRYAAQALGLVAQNFLAGAAGLAAGVAFIRGLARERSATLGNFWADLVRATLWVLLPISLVGALVLIWQGVPMNASPYVEATTLEGPRQVIAQGPVAALEIIKNLGANGGGFFNVNGAHPYENPTALANLVEMLAIVVLPAGLVVAFGRMTRRPRAAAMLLAVMTALFVAGLAVCERAEQARPPALAARAPTSRARSCASASPTRR